MYDGKHKPAESTKLFRQNSLPFGLFTTRNVDVVYVYQDYESDCATEI